MNLLFETKRAIEASRHKVSDIIFIGSQNSGHSCTWVEFKTLANREYHEGYGAQEVASDLIIVFSDGTKMWRGEYDGSEWWEFSPPFTAPLDTKPIKTLFAEGVGWESLAVANSRKAKGGWKR